MRKLPPIRSRTPGESWQAAELRRQIGVTRTDQQRHRPPQPENRWFLCQQCRHLWCVEAHRLDGLPMFIGCPECGCTVRTRSRARP
ncbi:hypothetical protein H0Z60_19180 [Ectothiorhodospiraceae bacterium WFHF3C12]|nr:hypothetical protein [Ectothiorhodospiraceae bacterium WFHF3C12]